MKEWNSWIPFIPATSTIILQTYSFHCCSIKVLLLIVKPSRIMMFSTWQFFASSLLQNCINQFTTLAQSQKCRFIGNICLGKQVSLAQLRPFYHAIVMVIVVCTMVMLGVAYVTMVMVGVVCYHGDSKWDAAGGLASSYPLALTSSVFHIFDQAKKSLGDKVTGGCWRNVCSEN